MAHHTDPDLLNNVLQLLTEQGHDAFAEGLLEAVGASGLLHVGFCSAYKVDG